MKSSKLYAILQSLDKSELRQLDKFLHSPYLNDIKQKQKAYELFELLKKNLLSGGETPDKEDVFDKIFEGQNFSNAKMDKLMARLLKAVKRFIIYEYAGLEDQQLESLLIQARFYRQKNLHKFFQQSIRNLQTTQREVLRKDKQYYLNQYRIEQEISEYAGLYNSRKEDLNLPNTLKSLDEFYVTAKLEYANWIIAQNNLHVPLQIQESLQLLEQITPIIESDFCTDRPVIEAYYYAYQLLKDKENEQIFTKLEKTIEQYSDAIPLEQLKALQTICRSFCIRKYNQGQEAYLQKGFDLYKAHLEGGYLYYQMGILPATVKNIVTFGMKLHEADWVLAFLQAHKNRIVGTEFPQGIYQFNLAHYHFMLGQYDKALDLLNDYPADTYYKIATRRLELKIYYELHSPLLESKIDSLKVYLFRISRHLLPDLPKEANNNFINLLRQIHNPQTMNNTKRIDKLQEKLLSKPHLERDWLMEKLEALKA